MNNRLEIILAALTLSLCCGCVNEEFEPVAGSSDIISFSTGLKEMGGSVLTRSIDDHLVMELSEWDGTDCATKASPSTRLEGDASIYCYQYATTLNPATDALFEDVKYSFDGDQLIPETPYAWANVDTGKKLRFFSLAPYDGGSEVEKITYSGGMTGMRYTVPAQASSQRDFLYASSAEVSSAQFRKPVAMQYCHALTAIQFRMGFSDVKVKSISIKQVNGRGVFTFVHALSLNKWAESDLPSSYTIDFGTGIDITSDGQMIVDGNNTLMLIPQDFDAESSAVIELVYTDMEGEHTITGSLAGSSWPMGTKIVYTLYKASVQYEYVYFDIFCGSVEITPTTYSGYVNVGGTKRQITGTKNANTRFYIYQSVSNSSSANYYKNTGYATEADLGHPETIRLPSYPGLTVGGSSWGDYITNNKDIVSVIEQWPIAAAAAGREAVSTSDRVIYIHGASNYDVTLDNFYSTQAGTAPVRFHADNGSRLILRLKGDSRFDRFDYSGSDQNTSKLFVTSADGNGATSGTMTICSFLTDNVANDNRPTFGPNQGEDSYGLTFNGGTVFAGNPPIQNNIWGERQTFKYTTGIGGGINHLGEVTINGGRLTAVSNGTSPAIGGGGGYQSAGGAGIVTVNGGEVYAYATGIYSTASGYDGFAPCTAIGGASTLMSDAKHGSQITITGGYVYAESLGGTAIGGGNAHGNGSTGNGGNAVINISGGTVVAKSVAGKANGGTFDVSPNTAIGGGSSVMANGGNATITISGGRLTTGSIGGGTTGSAGKYIGSANINISGSAQITGQFVMAKGADVAPSFTMTGGIIYNNNTSDSDCASVNLNGGAVYMEAGTCVISGGTIRNCTASKGGAIYLEGGEFTMNGGTITKNTSLYDGGAVCINGGNAVVSGGQMSLNIAKNGNGGGICVSGGSFSMPAGGTGEISHNAAHSYGTSNTGNGGGVYVSSSEDVDANLISGNMTYNTSDRNGGGICIDGGAGTNVMNVIIGKSGGTPASPYINDNSAAMSGGGMCVLGSNSVVTIYSGTIHGEVSAFVKNEDVRIDGGTVTLVGGSANCDIKFNTVRFNSNNGRGDVLEQRIVTNTNSKLVPPAGTASWTKEFHVLKEWNTKADVTGVSYDKNGGELMVISDDVDLYAIWTPSVSGS